ncbi:hypothetical protein FB385_2669 [Paramicrobacterium agarici]|nr:hypothetical protein FB385_2669 [Microbacterium agarici]
MSEQNTSHYVELVIEGGELHRRFRCTAPADAWCRRRPPEPDAERWTHEEATEPGHECWAVEWVELAGIEDAITGADQVLASVPVSIVYDEGVAIELLGEVSDD